MFTNLLALRNSTADSLVQKYASFTKERFSMASKMDSPQIVVIPACNEQADLPAALISLSKSKNPTIAIVVENGSDKNDKTIEYAERMGAITLQCKPAKMRATQLGLSYARKNYPKQHIVNFGDADNIYPRNCITAIAGATQKANRKNDGNGALLFGLGIYEHGSSVVVDFMRSGRILRKAISRKFSGKMPMPYGFNYAIHTGKNDTFTDAIMRIDPLLFVREESEICKAAIESCATISQLVSPRAIVFTRGDLIKSRTEWRDFKGATMETKTKYYKRNYPNVDFKPNPSGRAKKT